MPRFTRQSALKPLLFISCSLPLFPPAPRRTPPPKPPTPSRLAEPWRKRHGFRTVTAGAQLGQDLCRRRLGADVGRRRGLGRARLRLAVRGGLLPVGGLRANQRSVAGSVVGGDGGSGRALCDLDEHDRDTCGASRYPSQDGRGCVRGSVRDDGAPAGNRRQPEPFAVAGRDQLFGAEHRGDSCHRSPIHANVGPGRYRDVWLRRPIGSRSYVDAVYSGAQTPPTRPG
jgi:hypothetical protein